jgi:hypothetical protein
MSRDRKKWLDLRTLEYLEALERQDWDTQDRLWELARGDAELETALLQLHEGLAEEEQELLTRSIADAAEKHLVGTTERTPVTGPITVAHVAEELLRRVPEGLTAESHALNAKLRDCPDLLPEQLGLPKLIAWAEAKFGSAESDYWRAFREAALRLELRLAAQTEFQLAARRAPKPDGTT